MIRASVLYPNEPGKKFDLDYYINKHMVMVRKRLKSHGLVRDEVDLPPELVSPAIRAQSLFQHTPWEPYHAMSCVALPRCNPSSSLR